MNKKIKPSKEYLCFICNGTGIEQIGDFLWEDCEDCSASGKINFLDQRLKKRCQILAKTSCSYPKISKTHHQADSNIFQDIDKKSVVRNLNKKDRKYYIDCRSLKNFYRKCGLNAIRKNDDTTTYIKYPPE